MGVNALTTTGLTTQSYQDLYAIFQAAWLFIYGTDISQQDSSSPDNQAINNYIQVVLDNSDLITQAYNSFDVDAAIGIILDSRVAYNGITRLPGTFTILPETITVSGPCTLPGLDLFPDSPYVISDANGNQYELQVTQSPVAAGSFSTNFEAALSGALNPAPNTVTTPVTIVLGVVSVNNPTVATTVGTNEESDVALKLRRSQSVALGSQGWLAAAYAALRNIAGINSVQIYENNSGELSTGSAQPLSTNTPPYVPAGIPGNSIWVIINSTPPATTASSLATQIATAIYNKRGTGAGMLGMQYQIITQIDGTPFLIKWDIIVEQPLWTQFAVTPLNPTIAPNIAAIIAQLPGLLDPGAGQEVNITSLATLVQQIDPNTVVTGNAIVAGDPDGIGFATSLTGDYFPTLSPTVANGQFDDLTISILNMVLANPSQASVVHGGNNFTFSALGGKAAYAWSMISGGGSIVSGTGVYTSGVAGTDVIEVTDSLGNTATATITVT
jgi:hypothetical protein